MIGKSSFNAYLGASNAAGGRRAKVSYEGSFISNFGQCHLATHFQVAEVVSQVVVSDSLKDQALSPAVTPSWMPGADVVRVRKEPQQRC